MKLGNKALTRFSESLRLCPHAGSGVHSWLMSCANLAAIAGLAPMEAEAEIIRAMTRPPSPSSEVASAIRKAYEETVPGGAGTIYKPRNIAPAKPKPLPMTAAYFFRVNQQNSRKEMNNMDAGDSCGTAPGRRPRPFPPSPPSWR